MDIILIFLIVGILIALIIAIIKACINDDINIFESTGERGERHVSNILIEFSQKYGGYVINDVLIPLNNGRTTQIDHIYISSYGIFVIETKRYHGKIYGNSYMESWQVYYENGEKHTFYNPIKQNEGHIKAIYKKIRIDPNLIESIIVFDNGDVEHVDSDITIKSDSLFEYLKMFTYKEILTSDETENIYNALNYFKLYPKESAMDHIESVKNSHGNNAH